MPRNRTLADRFEAAAALGATLPAYARNLGIDIGPIAEATGLDPHLFADADARMGLDRFCRLLEALAMVSGNDCFGLDLATTFEAGMTGAFGYGLMSAPTFGDAVAFAIRHKNIIARTSRCELLDEGDDLKMVWTYSPLIVRRDQFVDFSGALLMARFRDIAGRHLDAAHVHLERPPPANPAVYRRAFTRTVTFGAAVNGIAFPRGFLDISNPRADARLFRLMDVQCRTPHPVGMQDETDLLGTIRLKVLEDMRGGAPSLLVIADHMGMSERTLQRRIADLGTNLHDIVDEAKRELAGRLLRDTSQSIAQIAYRLGFSQPSAFTRSVHRWFAMSPSDVRRNGAKPVVEDAARPD